jgi:DNA-binding CsgD family transcriptional regulator
MNIDYKKYNLFFEFIETYSKGSFKGIDRQDPLILKLEKMTETNNQFFYISDMIRMKIEFTSQRSYPMIGIKPDDLSPYHIKEATHPDDLQRNGLGFVKLFKIAHELFVAKKGEMLISSNFRIRNISGNYSNQLAQCYLFYMGIPCDTVYMLSVKTDIDWYKKKNGFHYYLGNDLNYFKYPDNELLAKDSNFSSRQFEIIKLVASGLSSEQIAEKLYLSTYTVNTHRANILKKSGKAHISELIYELREQGLI